VTQLLVAASPFSPSRYRGTPSNIAFREATSADDLNVVRDVILLRAGPGNLGQRHFYSEQCLRDAVERQIFEAAQCYLNHPTTFEEQTIPERDVNKLAGWFSDVTVRPYRDPDLGVDSVALFANFHPRVGDERVAPIVRTCLEYSKRYPRMAWAGLSIYAKGDSVPVEISGETWNRVDRIEEVESVDIVTRAGAGGTRGRRAGQDRRRGRPRQDRLEGNSGKCWLRGPSPPDSRIPRPPGARRPKAAALNGAPKRRKRQPKPKTDM